MWVSYNLFNREKAFTNIFKFVILKEEKYEWGNPKSVGVIPEPVGDIEKAIASAAYRWRLKLLDEPGGAFKDMVAILLVQGEKYNQFTRLIEAGGGTVVQARYVLQLIITFYMDHI